LYASKLGGLRPTATELERQREEQRLARRIVEANGIRFAGEDIASWVLRTGGAENELGTAVFTGDSVIFLPAGGPRPPAESSPVLDERSGKIGAGVFLVTALLSAWWWWKG
jgi:hypothetical protein